MPDVTIDRAIWEVMLKGVSESEARMKKFRMSWDEQIDKCGTAGIVKNISKLRSEIDQMTTHTSSVSDVMKNMGGNLKKAGSDAKTTGDKFGYLSAKIDSLSKLYDVQWAIKGMFMGVGWQMITTMIQHVKTAVTDLFMANVELESSMIAISTVAQRTGRDFGEVKGVITSSFDAFTDKAKLTSGTMKLLSTSLSTSEIQEFINAVKQGSAAMGLDFNEQLELMARGFKQLTPNLLDNIGVTVYLDDVRKKASDTLGIEVSQLSEAQIHHQLLVEILKQTAKYEGLWEAQMDTTKGKIMAVNTQYKLFMQTISNSEPIKIAADALGGFLEKMRLTLTLIADYEKYGIEVNKEYMESIGEVGASKWFSESGAGTSATVMAFPMELKREMQDRVDSVDATVERLAELRKAYGNQIMTEDEYISHLEHAANVLGKRRIDIMIAIENEMEMNEVKDKSKNMTEIMNDRLTTYSKTLEETNKREYDATEEGKRYAEMLEEITGELNTANSELSDMKKAVEENEEIIYSKNRELFNYNKQLTEVSDKLKGYIAKEKELTSVLKESEKQRDVINRQLEAKLNVLYPEEMATEKRLQQVRKDLERARGEEEKAEDALYKRVEPTLFRKHQKDYAESQEEVTRYTEGEKVVKAALLAEIEALTRQRDEHNQRINREKAEVEEIVGLINKETLERNKLANTVRGLKTDISNLTEENKIYKHTIEEMTKEGGTIPTLDTKIKDLTTSIGDMYTAWNQGKFEDKTISVKYEIQSDPLVVDANASTRDIVEGINEKIRRDLAAEVNS